MSRWLWFTICALTGVLLFIAGLLVPAHLRAVDVSVIERAGRGSPSLINQGLASVDKEDWGPARLLLRAGEESGIREVQELGSAITNTAVEHPEGSVLGCNDRRLEEIFGPALRGAGEMPFTEFIIQRDRRDKALEVLRESPSQVVQGLLGYRTRTDTVLFSPSRSASGQALDAAIAICGLLLDGRHLSAEFSANLSALVTEANHGGNAQQFEQVLLDLLSLGQRYDWAQLTAFVSGIREPETLRVLTSLVRKSDDQAPVLFAGVQLSGRPAQVVNYVMKFSETGMNDIKSSLQYGVGGVRELVKRGQQLESSDLRRRAAGVVLAGPVAASAAEYAWVMPRFALTAKWLLYLGAGFLLAMAAHFAKPLAPPLERPLEVRGFHYIREFLFALGFLLVVLLLSEPFLAQESQKMEIPFRLHLPTVGNVVAAGTSAVHHTIMNQMSLLTLLLFFIIQSLIYTACLVKLAEVRRQDVPPRIKLKLLDNEDHLFDAGLYIGFVGTIISLILVSLGVIKPSLMAAYSSTSFGIIFVSIFKIFHLRPTRRKLLLEAEKTRVVLHPVPAYATES